MVVVRKYRESCSSQMVDTCYNFKNRGRVKPWSSAEVNPSHKENSSLDKIYNVDKLSIFVLNTIVNIYL